MISEEPDACVFEAGSIKIDYWEGYDSVDLLASLVKENLVLERERIWSSHRS